MSDLGFEHPIAKTVFDALVPGDQCTFALDAEGLETVVLAIKDVLLGEDAVVAYRSLTEMVGFLSVNDGQEAANTLFSILLLIEFAARNAGINVDEEIKRVDESAKKYAKFSGKNATAAPAMGEADSKTAALSSLQRLKKF